MIERKSYLSALETAVSRSPVTALLGPRQCGKTTLARIFGEQRDVHYFDLESIADQRRLQNPEMMLSTLRGLIVLDEIQLQPELFSVLRVLVDQRGFEGRFLVLGSASPHIIRNVSETLAGRVEFIELSGFDLREIGSEHSESLWVRGGFPRSWLAASEEDSLAWREGFIRTFLERDIPALGIHIAPTAMRRFWTMLAHYHGQTWNASELARSMGVSDKTVRSYLDILTATFMVRQLQPWHENLRKRQVKAPKIYFRDSGILHALLNIPDYHVLTGHPRLGASWEGFALEQVAQALHPDETYFWSTHGGAEVDLLIFDQGKRIGVEFKFSEAPKITRSMHTAVEDLSLDQLWVVYPGKEAYPVTKEITVRPLIDVVC
ncbi:MAG: ATP-binding protein [Sedimenticola sp.]